MGAKPKNNFEVALRNIVKYGDTDIFPFPIENHILHDQKAAVVKQLQDAYSSFDQYLTLAHQMSGKTASELFGDIIYFLSSSGISR